MNFAALAVLAFLVALVNGDVYFTYGPGVDQWGLISKYCDGLRQSPIDLNMQQAQIVSEDEPLELLNVRENPTKVRVYNNGHTVSKGVVLRGGRLDGTFKFASLHFHWSSEHTIDMERYPLEMHMVFYNQEYGSLQQAQFQPNGLAVLGFFFAIRSGAESRRWLDSLKSVQKAGSKYTFVHPNYLNLAKIIGTKVKPYFYYEGSLTTPLCYETVSWIVQKEPLAISAAQMKLFGCLKARHGYMTNNYRPLQDINGRSVLYFANQ